MALTSAVSSALTREVSGQLPRLLATSLAVVDLPVLLASAVGVAVLNLTIATDRRPGRYVAP